MRYCTAGGFIKGKEKVKGNSIKNDIVKMKGVDGAPDIHVSPGEMIIDKETIEGGPMSILKFAIKELHKNGKLKKEHFDEGGILGSIRAVFGSNDEKKDFPSTYDLLHGEKPKSNYDEGGLIQSVMDYFKDPAALAAEKRERSGGQSSSAPPVNRNLDPEKAKKFEGVYKNKGGMIDKSMAHGGEINNSLSPDNALNQCVPEKGIIGGTIYDGSTDEKFVFGDYCFDIEKARDMCQKHSNAEIPVSEKWVDKIKLNKREAIDGNSKNPVFIAQIHTPNGLKPLLIDGNHRMYRAIYMGEKSIPAYVFSPEQTHSLFCQKPDHIKHPKDEIEDQYYFNGGMVKNYNEGGLIDFQPLSDEKHGEIDFHPLEQESAKKPESSLGEKALTGLESYGKAATLGYLPQIQAGVSKGLGKIGLLPEQDYTKERDVNIQRQLEQEKENPKSALAGEAAGLVGSAVLTPELPFLKGAGIMKGIGRGAVYGAGYGAAQNPGDVEGEISPLQAKERLKNAGMGTVLGGAVGGAAAGVSKGISALRNSADVAQEIANTQAVRAAGGDLKSIRILNAKDKLDDIGKFALDNKIVEAGDSPHSVAEKADVFRKQAGKKLDDIYGQAKKLVFSDPTNEAQFRGFNPARDDAAILNSVNEKMGDSPDKATALRNVRSYLDQLKEDYGDKLLDPKVANNIKSQLDKQINYNRNPLHANPAAEEGFSVMRDYVNNAVKDHIEDIGKAFGNPKLAEELQKANKEYGYAKQLQTMSEDRVNRDIANRMFGLTDTIAGIGGGAAGAFLGAESGHAGAGAALGLAAGAANKIARTYGPGAIAGMANKAAPILEKTAVPMGEMLSKIPQSIIEKAAIQGATNNDKFTPLSGPKKWANDGMTNLINGAQNPIDKQMIQSMKSKLLSDPKGLQLLIEASYLKPGSSRLNKILSDIKGMQ